MEHVNRFCLILDLASFNILGSLVIKFVNAPACVHLSIVGLFYLV